jgi:hypothetical protein
MDLNLDLSVQGTEKNEGVWEQVTEENIES